MPLEQLKVLSLAKGSAATGGPIVQYFFNNTTDMDDWRRGSNSTADNSRFGALRGDGGKGKGRSTKGDDRNVSRSGSKDGEGEDGQNSLDAFRKERGSTAPTDGMPVWKRRLLKK